MNFNHDTGSIDTILTIDTSQSPPLGGTTNTLTINGTGAIRVPVGNTAARPSNASGWLRYNSETVGLEYNTGSGWFTVANTAGGGGTVTSVAVSGSTGLTVGGSPVTTSGTITLTLDSGLQTLASLATTGMIAQSATDTFVSRTITGTASNISVTNGDGVSGNPTIDLINAGTPVSNQFVKITTDSKGRVTATNAVAAGDITTLVDATYVNVSGDSMNSAANLTFSGGGEVLGLPAVPSGATAAASKAYVDSVAQGMDPKASVRAATTAAGTLASSFANGSTIDGITLATGDRILIKNQAAPAENGIYTVNAAGAPTRATDMDAWSEVPGAFVWVEVGTTNADTGWVCTADQGGTLNTTSITWSQFGGVGTYTAGTGLTLTGNQFSLTTPVSVANGGTGLSSTPTNGQIDIGNGTNFTRTTLTQGTGITITNGAGSITIANAGVTSLAGTANQITASASTGSVTLSLPSTVVAPGSVAVTTALYESISAAVSAAGSTQGTATALTASKNIVTTVAASTGVVLPAAVSPFGWEITIVNRGANPLAVYPATGAQIDAAGANTAVTLPVGEEITLVSASATQWYAVETIKLAGTGISVTYGNGTTTFTNTGVTTFSAGTTGLTPNSATSGAVTLAGTLNIANGGTGTATTSQNFVFVGPTSGSGAPSFRALTFGDLTNTAIKLYSENPSTPVAPTSSGSNAVSFGSGATAGGVGAFGVGTGSSAGLFGQKAFASGSFTAAGDAQGSKYILRNSTTDATVTELFLDGSSARLVVPNNSVFTFNILIAARRTDSTGGGAGYRVEGVIRKDTTSGSVTLVGSPAKSILGETNTAWDVTVDADTTNGSLRIRVTGEAAKTIRWVAVVDTAEVTN